MALVRAGIGPNGRDRRGRTALMEAACFGHLRTAQALIAEKADVDASTAAGLTALTEAARRGVVVEVTRVLGCLEGCEPDGSCSQGRPVGGRAKGRVERGAEIRVRTACLTHTAVAPVP